MQIQVKQVEDLDAPAGTTHVRSVAIFPASAGEQGGSCRSIRGIKNTAQRNRKREKAVRAVRYICRLYPVSRRSRLRKSTQADRPPHNQVHLTSSTRATAVGSSEPGSTAKSSVARKIPKPLACVEPLLPLGHHPQQHPLQ